MTDDVWGEFFDSSAPQRTSEVCTTDGEREGAFPLGLLELPTGASIADIGCGAGTAGDRGRRLVERDGMKTMTAPRRPAA